jgi:hypothetical protein
MASPRRHVPVLLLIVVLAAAILSGCGTSAPTDRDQIAAIIKSEGTDPASLCGHLADTLLARFGGKSACLRQAASSAKDPSTHAASVKVHGRSATAIVADRSGSRTITLVKQRGNWKISGVS